MARFCLAPVFKWSALQVHDDGTNAATSSTSRDDRLSGAENPRQRFHGTESCNINECGLADVPVSSHHDNGAASGNADVLRVLGHASPALPHHPHDDSGKAVHGASNSCEEDLTGSKIAQGGSRLDGTPAQRRQCVPAPAEPYVPATGTTDVHDLTLDDASGSEEVEVRAALLL